MRSRGKQSQQAPLAQGAKEQQDAEIKGGEEDGGKYLRKFLQADGGMSGRTTSGSEKEDKPTLLAKEDRVKKMRSFKTRTASTVVLIGGFIIVIWAGHVPLLFLVLIIQMLMVREVFDLGRMLHEASKLPGFRAQQWYFFFVSTFYTYLRFISTNLLIEASSTKALARFFSWVVKRHLIISYFMYCIGFMMFVLSLKRGMYLYQFAQYAWTHMIIIMVIMPTSFFVANTFQGIIWYVMPAMLIIANDIFAYLSGFFFGRTPLIRLSPKKTWEGFIGALIFTAFFAFYVSRIMAQFTWLTCPRKDLSIGALRCKPSSIFEDRVFTIKEVAEVLPGPLEEILSLMHALLPADMWNKLEGWSISAMPVQLHAMTMSFFASLISPFGGFFASGFKRAFKLKDFGDTIPGHGGITDRFDCQVLMAVFSYLYYWNYVHVADPSVVDVLEAALKLSNTQQLELFARLGNLLTGEGLLPGGIMDGVASLVNLNQTGM